MIKIEITGSSIAEVADKLLALGSSLKNGAAMWWTQTDAPEKLRQTLRAEREAELNPDMPEVAEVAAAPEPSAGPATTEPAAETTEAGPSVGTATASPSEPVISADTLRELVLAVVREKGREAMVAVLDTFGAARASDVPAAQTAELVAALEALL